MKLAIQEEVTVITPTTGGKGLKKAIESVEGQTYSNIKHLVVIDGPGVVIKDDVSGVFTTRTPWNTGAGGFYGHKIYASYPQIINSKYIAFLDDDNTYRPSHIESMVDLLEEKDHDWVHSLRSVHLNEVDGGGFLAYDNCEAIGRYPIWFTADMPAKDYLVDTSCYLFKTDFLKNVAHYWNSGWGADRRFFNIIHKQLGHENFGCTGLWTLNYTLPPIDKAYGGNKDFFRTGNEATLNRYGGQYPWEV